MMDSVTVDWAQGIITVDGLEQSKNPCLDQAGFYAILAGNLNATTKRYTNLILLYIGQAYNQTLRVRIPQEHDAYECVNAYARDNPTVTLLIMVGVVTDMPGNRATQQLYDDVECCLINKNQPRCNTACKDNYSGRDLTVTNTGDFSPLAQQSVCRKPK
jgi:hypothetical protein